MTGDFPEDLPGRPIWLMTLADLALLIVGFFVFLQAAPPIDGRALASSIRAGFGVATPPLPSAMPVELARVDAFTAGSAVLPPSPGVIEWARGAARDPRTHIRSLGETDGSRADVDAATGSAAILAADRARAVAAMLVRSGAVSPARIAITTDTDGGKPGLRAVTLTIAYPGHRQ
jgi:hypothetical protein